MVKIFTKLEELAFGKLMQVYRESNLENALERYSNMDKNAALLNAEQDFYVYLRDCFFKTDGAFYAVWEENGQYVSALRMEPYQDGMLLEALETSPEYRQRGYAQKLIIAALEEADGKTYSHVNKKNIQSLSVHLKCGFEKISDTAVYIDGSEAPWCVTLCYGK